MNSVVETALITAAARARESARKDALFNDPYALYMAGKDGIRMLENFERAVPEVSGLIPAVIRTYFIDNQLKSIADNYDFDQVVLLGCGMDTRAFRTNYLSSGYESKNRSSLIAFYELDHPELIRSKNTRLLAHNIYSPFKRVAIGCDLASDDLHELLITNGLNPDLRTVWIAEGLFIYLEESSVHRLLEQVTTLSFKGSFFLCDLINTSLASDKATEPLRHYLATSGFPMKYANDDPTEILNQYGWYADIYTLRDTMRHIDRFSNMLSSTSTVSSGDAYLVSAVRK
jgi:methyltransferase (TIGR00027 family)